jgi:aryl-alcohol dehydrogenase-like predicted oxidoreductase
MRKIVLGRIGVRVSAISLGTWAFGGENMSGKFSVGWGGQTNKDSKSALLKSWEGQINHWDTADVYGDGLSESIIGSMWKDVPRNEIFLATKVGWDKGPHKNWYHPAHMTKNINRSLHNLKTDCVDLLYLHHCNFGSDDEYFDDAVSVIKKFQSEGKVKYIGLSDWSSTRILKYAKRFDPDVIQPYHNVMDDDYTTTGLKEYVNTNNLGVCFFSPLKHGLLTGKYDKPTTFEPGDHRSNIKDFQNLKILDKLKENKLLLERKFKAQKHPVLFGLINSLFTDSITGCVLLGQRNIAQVEAACSLGSKIDKKYASWVKQIYKF